MERDFKIVGEYEELNNLSTIEILQTLAYVNENEAYRGTAFHEALLDIVMNLGIVRNRLENYMPYKMYGYYGKHEIAFVYQEDCLSLDLYIQEMTNEIRELFKTLSLKKMNPEMTNYMPFLSAWLGFQLKDANKKVVLKYAKTRYPELTQTMLGLYVYIRKNTDYEFTLEMSNSEVFELFKRVRPDSYEKEFKKVTWYGLNHLKRIFGYPEEVNEAYEKKKNFQQTHRNEILFWQRTGACMIPDVEYQNTCSIYATELNLTKDQFQKLYDWCLKCKYQGVYKTDDIEIKKIKQTIIEKYGINSAVDKVISSGVRGGYRDIANKNLSTKEVLDVVLNF